MFFIYLFFLGREREHKQGRGKERGRENRGGAEKAGRERIPSRLCTLTAQILMQGLNS